jgi:translation elongation factor P/translation initiation factor 5A
MCQQAYNYFFPLQQNGERSLREGSIKALLRGPNRTGKSSVTNELAQHIANTKNRKVFYVLIDMRSLNSLKLVKEEGNQEQEQISKTTEVAIQILNQLHEIARRYTEETGEEAVFLPILDEVDNKKMDPDNPLIINITAVTDYYNTHFPINRTTHTNKKELLEEHLLLTANNRDKVSINRDLAKEGKTNDLNTLLLRIENFLNFEYARKEEEVTRVALCIITDEQIFEKNYKKTLQIVNNNEENKVKLNNVLQRFEESKKEATDLTKEELVKAYPEYVDEIMKDFNALCDFETRRQHVRNFLLDNNLPEFDYDIKYKGDYDILSKVKKGRNQLFDEIIDGILKCINIPSLSLAEILSAVNEPGAALEATEVGQNNSQNENRTTVSATS